MWKSGSGTGLASSTQRSVLLVPNRRSQNPENKADVSDQNSHTICYLEKQVETKYLQIEMRKQLIQRAVEEQGQSGNVSVSSNRTNMDRGDESLL